MFMGFETESLNRTKLAELEDLHLMIEKSFASASKKLSPLWDIRDYVAVNPFFGLRDQNFLKTLHQMQNFYGRSLFPKKLFFQNKWNLGEITSQDLQASLAIFNSENPKFQSISLQDLNSYLLHASDDFKFNQIESISDIFEKEKNLETTEYISRQVSKWLSVYFDEGQALWKIKTANDSLYTWWKNLCCYDSSFDKYSPNFKSFVLSLPDNSAAALEAMTLKLQKHFSINKDQLSNYYFRLLCSVSGWAAYLQKFEFEATRSGHTHELEKVGGLKDILALRMAYDLSLLNHIPENKTKLNLEHGELTSETAYSYIWLTASELTYARKVKLEIDGARNVQAEIPKAQMVFCIDVRSEVIRRKLEVLDDGIQTLGFAGFFGLPISVKGLGHQKADQQCPVLLNAVTEIPTVVKGRQDLKLALKRVNSARQKYFTKAVQTSFNSGFSWVETFGLSYLFKMLGSSLGYTSPNINLKTLGITHEQEKMLTLDVDSIDLDQRIAFAENALTNMGLTTNFAPLVIFFGHGAETVNNPYASALDCGACAGHNGHGNSKVLATLLNNKTIRGALAHKGIHIPEQTVFLAGWHNTTKDNLSLDDDDNLSAEQLIKLNAVKDIIAQATQATRLERAQYLPLCSGLNAKELENELSQKSKNWSEIRPEWGLAKNASFIVGRRAITRGVDLQGRSFLHDYDFNQDPDLARLELIMTAPMIVTNWINMQYYASTVDPVKFGVGNKVLNNVVGGIGCIQGNSSDLLGGLAEQSVWYKGQYYHEPIRLQVFIETTPEAIDVIVKKHQMVHDLIKNHWLRVTLIDPKTKEFTMYSINNLLH